VLAIGMLIGLINLFNRDMQVVHGVVALILIGGLLLRPLLGWLIPALDRARVSRELKAARELARQGRGPDPFGPREVQLGPEGYVLRTPYGEAQHSWNDVSRAEWFDGYVFVFLASDRVRRETVGLILPPRAFSSPGDARELRERIEGWRTASAAAGRPFF
jgi:YcxB-like protein